MEIKTSISEIPLQTLLADEFSAADLTWTKISTSEHHVDDVALIPYARVEAFITGESNNAEHPTRFHIERNRKRERGSLKEYKNDDYLLYRMYWCSFGPENYTEGGEMLPSRKYRLNTRKRAARPQSMRGCTCHFSVKRLYSRPLVALIIYHERKHVNKLGLSCHGPLDRDAIGPKAKKVPYVCSEVQQQTLSLMYLGLPEENVLQAHIEGVQRYSGPNRSLDSASSQYIQKMGMIIKRSTHELDLNDQASVRIWVEKNKKSVFYYQDASESDPFILGIQTEWQLQQTVRFGHGSLVAAHSSFGISKLKYPLTTLLVYDSTNHALPIAWIITRSISKTDVFKYMKALVERVRNFDPSWTAGGWIVDDPTSQLDPIRELFSCPILFSTWRIRRSWLKNVVKRCRNGEIQCEIFRRLGEIVRGVWRQESDPMGDLEVLFQDFVDQVDFVEYFKSFWVPKLEMWLEAIRTLPLSSLESNGAIEEYHLNLKQKAYEDSHLDSLQRVDWLVHRLTTEIHSTYWLSLHSFESGSFPDVKERFTNSTSWYRALKIPDQNVVFCEEGRFCNFAKVLSVKSNGGFRTVRNLGSEFSCCDCDWALKGNLCKHVLKVNNVILERKNGILGTSLSCESFKQVIYELSEKPFDDSTCLDESLAWVLQVQERVLRLNEVNFKGVEKVVSGLEMKWGSKKERTFVGNKAVVLTSFRSRGQKRGLGFKRSSRKRKRVSRL
ncbi:hypothetical protein LUZ60_005999 [Juncus effusus]|nr:hypothetical protein LUZ60_005999 [Juncus effusus]